MSESGFHTHSPEQLTLQPNGLWIGESGKLYSLTNHGGKCVWVEIESPPLSDGAKE